MNKQEKLTKTELTIKNLWEKNHSIAQIALQTHKTIAQVATVITKLYKINQDKGN